MQTETLTGKRGGGKTFKALVRLTETALAKPEGRYLFVGPNPRSAELMTNTLDEHHFPRDKIKALSRTKAQLTLCNDSAIRFIGEDSISTLRGLRFDGIVADATECWDRRERSLEALSANLNPDGVLIETRFE